MKKVLGSHTIVDRNGQQRTMAVLECGHEVDYGAVKWPEGMAQCPVTEHDDDGHALRAAGPTPTHSTGPQ